MIPEDVALRIDRFANEFDNLIFILDEYHRVLADYDKKKADEFLRSVGYEDFDALTSAIQNKSLQLRYFLMDVVRRPDVNLSELRNYIAKLPFKSKESILSTYDKIMEEEVSIEETRTMVGEMRSFLYEMREIMSQIFQPWREYFESGRAAISAPAYSVQKASTVEMPSKKYARECWNRGIWMTHWGNPADYGIRTDPDYIKWFVGALDVKPSVGWKEVIKIIANNYSEEDRKKVLDILETRFGS